MTSQELGAAYDSLAPKIYRYLLYRTQHTETAEDLTAQTFVKAVQHLSRYDARQGTFSAWMYRIARNTLIDHYRLQSNASSVPIEDVWDLLKAKTDMAQHVDDVGRISQVQTVLSQLPPAQRELLLLRMWDGYSFAEIAEITGKSEAACKMGVSRGLKTLRAQLPLATLLFLLTHPLF